MKQDRYNLLFFNEKIEKGDQYYRADNMRWNDVEDYRIGKTLTTCHEPHRRLILPEKPTFVPISRKEAIDELMGLAGIDPEAAHGAADDILCRLLCTLGYEDVIEQWEKIDKWYA